MKTVTGKAISTTPISLSKAASILSKFICTETGASHAVGAYLRRASVSFSELTQLHKELNPSLKSDRKHKKPKSEEILAHSVESSQKPSGLGEEKVSHEIKHKSKKKKEVKIEKEEKKLSQEPSREVKAKKKKKEEVKGEVGNFRDNEGQNGNFDRKVKIVKIDEEEKKLSQGQNGNFDMKVKIEEEVVVVVSEEEGERQKDKKKKKHKKDRGEIGRIKEEKEEEGERKKRKKSEEVEEEEGKENSTEERRRKKKKVKSEGDS